MNTTTGLNTMVTFRQSNGLSAVGYSTPKITWDGNFTNTAATTLDLSDAPNVDDNLKQISGTPAVQLGTSGPTSTFGQGPSSWGAFGYGFLPANSGPGDTGNSTIVYPSLPIYGSVQRIFVGGPPAFPQVQNGSGLAGQVGAFLGFTTFADLTPAPNSTSGASTFTLTLTVPTGFNANTPTFGTLTKSAVMKQFTPLPPWSTAPVLTVDSSLDGGATIAYSLPAGVSEAYLLVTDVGPGGAGALNANPNCNYGGAPKYYTIRVTPSSPNPAVLPPNLASPPVVGQPSALQSTHTICSAADNTKALGATTPGDDVVVQGVGFDYPAYASSYPSSNGNAAPPISGANGQADITVSPVSAAVTSSARSSRRAGRP